MYVYVGNKEGYVVVLWAPTINALFQDKNIRWLVLHQLECLVRPCNKSTKPFMFET